MILLIELLRIPHYDSDSRMCLTIYFEFSYLSEPAAGSSKQVDLFGDSLIGDLMDAPTSVPAEMSPVNGSALGVDLFADATFVSAKPQPETGANALTSVPVETSTLNDSASGVDLFDEATFISANSQPKTGANSQPETGANSQIKVITFSYMFPEML